MSMIEVVELVLVTVAAMRLYLVTELVVESVVAEWMFVVI